MISLKKRRKGSWQTLWVFATCCCTNSRAHEPDTPFLRKEMEQQKHEQMMEKATGHQDFTTTLGVAQNILPFPEWRWYVQVSPGLHACFKWYLRFKSLEASAAPTDENASSKLRLNSEQPGSVRNLTGWYTLETVDRSFKILISKPNQTEKAPLYDSWLREVRAKINADREDIERREKAMHALEDHGFCWSSSLKGPVFCCSICSASFSHVLSLPSIQKITSRKFQSSVSGAARGFAGKDVCRESGRGATSRGRQGSPTQNWFKIGR